MTEYRQLECYLDTAAGVEPLLERYRELLELLTGDLASAGELVASFPMDERIDARLMHPKKRPTLRLRREGARPRVEPLILGWASTGRAHLSRPHLEMSLLFQAADLTRDGVYEADAGRAIWETAVAFYRAFQQAVFFTNEENDGKAWEAVAHGRGHLCEFDLAIFPPGEFLSTHDLPFAYEMVHLAGMDAAIHRAAWARAPWL